MKTTTVASTVRGIGNDMPSLRRPINGVRPETVRLTVCEDLSGSGAGWAKGITQISTDLVREIGSRFAQCRWDYIGMRDQDIGEHDEVRLLGVSGEDFLRDQQLVEHVGGGDADETFAQTVEDLLSRPDWMTYVGPNEALGLVLFTTSSTKPAKGNTLEVLGEELKNRRINLYVIGTPGTNMQTLVDAAGGIFFELKSDPSPADTQRLAANLGKTVAGTLRTAAATVRDTPADPALPKMTTVRGVGAVGSTVARP